MSKIQEEWDNISQEKYNDRKKGKDKSYENILKPLLIKELKENNAKLVLDLGCGTGELTSLVGDFSKKLIGIDISCKSIEIAKSQHQRDNIEYIDISIEDFYYKKKFSLVYSNISLVNIECIDICFQRVGHLLMNGGKFIFIIPHPAFWPIYWDYNKDGFDYIQETSITRDFQTKETKFKDFKTTHFHRPIEKYINLGILNHFKLLNFIEITDNNTWYPRFLYFEFIKNKL